MWRVSENRGALEAEGYKPCTRKTVKAIEPLRIQYGRTVVYDPSRIGLLDAGSADDVGKGVAKVRHDLELDLVFRHRSDVVLEALLHSLITTVTLDPDLLT